MINALANICKENLIVKKLLLVPSYQIGQNIIKILNGKIPILNLRIETMQDIATQKAMPFLSANTVDFADDSISRQIMFGIIYNMQKNSEFEYFTDIQATPSISNSIWNAIMEIKCAGLSQCDIENSCFAGGKNNDSVDNVCFAGGKNDDSVDNVCFAGGKNDGFVDNICFAGDEKNRSINNSYFVCGEKGRDINKIILAYDSELQHQGLVDYPGILQMVLQNDSIVSKIHSSERELDIQATCKPPRSSLGSDYKGDELKESCNHGISYLNSSSKEDGLILIPNSMHLRLLEKRLVTTYFSSIQILYGNRLNGISVPKSYFCSNYPTVSATTATTINANTTATATNKTKTSANETGTATAQTESAVATTVTKGTTTGESPFVNLFALEKLSPETDYSSIELVKAVGENNEIEAVLRNVKEKQIPFDNVCIYTTSHEPYAQLLYQKAQQLNMPVTFGYGVNIQNSKPGKAFSGIVRWIGSNYQITDFISMLYQELLEIHGVEKENINSYKAANVLRASGIGWGRGRYIPVLEDLIEHLKTQSSMKDEYRLKKIEMLVSIKQFFDNLSDKIPVENDDQISLNKLAKGISYFLDEFVPQRSQLDAEAKIIITESLNKISLGAELLVDIDDALNILKSNIQSIRIGVSSPKEGHVHICSIDNGFFINRRHNYFTGFDADRFPGNISEDPILLDVEKQKLSKNILQNSQRANERLYKTTELLSDLKGYITIIYSSFDPAENRETTPSSFILQLFRMISKNEFADYSNLQNHYRKTQGYITKNAIDDSEYWLEKCFKAEQEKNKNELISECYSHLKHGIKAWDNRSTDKFTHYDGYTENIGIETGDKVFSASKLELLAKCPYQYFLRYVLNISPPDETIYDPDVWLDPLQRGTLYHTIFEKFYKVITERKENPNRESHASLILEIARAEIDEYKKQIPPPNEMVFDVEVGDILESCIVFLTSEEENSDDGMPIKFELGFGINDGGYPPVEVTLPSNRKFLMSGKIDRIDKLSEDKYRIIDYKSGGTYGFSDRDFFKKGRQIQHALYAYACEVLLRNNSDTKDAKVTEGVYLFPTKKGEGRRFTRIQGDISKFFELLDDLFTIIDEGTFAATEEPGDCRWCDYKTVCRIHRLEKNIKAKRNDNSVEALSALRGINSYE